MCWVLERGRTLLLKPNSASSSRPRSFTSKTVYNRTHCKTELCASDCPTSSGFTHTMPFPCHAVPLNVWSVYFPFDLHSAAVFDSHMPGHSYAVPLPRHQFAVLKAISQGYDRFAAGSRQGRGVGTECVN
jgi:hypothetical protein